MLGSLARQNYSANVHGLFKCGPAPTPLANCHLTSEKQTSTEVGSLGMLTDVISASSPIYPLSFFGMFWDFV